MIARDDAFRMHYNATALEEGEVVSHSWTASNPLPGVTSAAGGGVLTLTNRRLIFEAQRTPMGALKKLAGIFNPTAGAAADIGAEAIEATHILDNWSAPLDQITAVDPGTGRSSTLRVTLRSGEEKIFGVFASLFTPVFSAANLESRDAAIATIRQANQGALPPVAADQAPSSPFVGRWQTSDPWGSEDAGANSATTTPAILELRWDSTLADRSSYSPLWHPCLSWASGLWVTRCRSSRGMTP